MTALQPLTDWTVPAEEIDHLGHMSTLFYAYRSDKGAARIIERLAGRPDAPAAQGLMAAVVDRHTHFRREQLQGANLSLAGGVAAASPQRLDLYQEMANVRTGDIAAMFHSGVRLQHVETREPAAVPTAWLDAAPSLKVEPPARSQPRTLALERMGADLTPDAFTRAGVVSHFRRDIAAADCDPYGFLAPTPPKLTWSRADRPSQGVMDQVWGAVDGFAWPALEVRVLSLRVPRRGDVLETYGALVSVGHKVIQSGMWIFEAHSGALVSVMQQVTIFFDLTARKAQDMPAALRARLDQIATPDLLGRGHGKGVAAARP